MLRSLREPGRPRRSSARPGVRAWASWAGLIAIAAIVIAVPAGADQAEPSDASVITRGGEVYAVQCAACHGPRGEGGTGPGDRGGPPIAETLVVLNDQMVRTGRMPIVDLEAGVRGPTPLGDDDREALLAWMTDRLDLRGEPVEVSPGAMSRGADLYAIHCAACHGSTGTGGVAGGGVAVLGVLDLDDVAVASAIRAGPLQMPAFGPDVLSDDAVDDITTYVVDGMGGAPRSAIGLGEINRVQGAVMTGIVALALLSVVALVAREPAAADIPAGGRTDAGAGPDDTPDGSPGDTPDDEPDPDPAPAAEDGDGRADRT